MFKKWFHGKQHGKSDQVPEVFSVQLDRESVAAGDDMSSHKCIETYSATITVAEFLEALLPYIPKIPNTVWLIWEAPTILGYIIFTENNKVTFDIENDKLLLKDCLSSSDVPEVVCLYYFKGNQRLVDVEEGAALLETVKNSIKKRV